MSFGIMSLILFFGISGDSNEDDSASQERGPVSREGESLEALLSKLGSVQGSGLASGKASGVGSGLVSGHWSGLGGN
jgi:hypothetical protein